MKGSDESEVMKDEKLSFVNYEQATISDR